MIDENYIPKPGDKFIYTPNPSFYSEQTILKINNSHSVECSDKDHPLGRTWSLSFPNISCDWRKKKQPIVIIHG